jgi:hypothetical protein
MKALKKIIIGTCPVVLLLSGCGSMEAPSTDSIQFTVHYRDSDAITRQGVPFLITNDAAQPDDLQPSARQSIANSRVWVCDAPQPCAFIPTSIFIDYEIKKNENGYDINGALVTLSTVKMKVMDRSEFEVHLTHSTSQEINNNLGAIATLEFKYPE